MISTAKNNFEALYINLRSKEGRIYADAELLQLPDITPTHIHAREWQLRKKSAMKLINYLEKKRKPLSILEVGCGNGWLCARLSGVSNASVTGTDINLEELQQARRVFCQTKNLRFVEADIRTSVMEEKFDIILFAASIQYFPFIDEIIGAAMNLLKEDGEIHIIDSYFYTEAESKLAKQRTAVYFNSMDCGQMSAFYFHQEVSALKKYQHKLLYDPSAMKHKILGNKNPFPWVCIWKT